MCRKARQWVRVKRLWAMKVQFGRWPGRIPRLAQSWRVRHTMAKCLFGRMSLPMALMARVDGRVLGPCIAYRVGERHRVGTA